MRTKMALADVGGKYNWQAGNMRCIFGGVFKS